MADRFITEYIYPIDLKTDEEVEVVRDIAKRNGFETEGPPKCSKLERKRVNLIYTHNDKDLVPYVEECARRRIDLARYSGNKKVRPMRLAAANRE